MLLQGGEDDCRRSWLAGGVQREEGGWWGKKGEIGRPRVGEDFLGGRLKPGGFGDEASEGQ